MKIKDFSEEKGLSKQAIYKAISRAGFSAKQLTDRQGNITAKGLSILSNLFPDLDGNESSTNTEQQTNTEVEQLKRKISDLETKCAEWERRYFDAVESSKKESEQLRILISQEQQLRLAAEKQGFFRRLFSGKSTNND